MSTRKVTEGFRMSLACLQTVRTYSDKCDIFETAFNPNPRLAQTLPLPMHALP